MSAPEVAGSVPRRRQSIQADLRKAVHSQLPRIAEQVVPERALLIEDLNRRTAGFFEDLGLQVRFQ